MLKKLKNFTEFKSNEFLKDKSLVFLSGKVVATEKFEGVQMEVMISDDRTDYGNDAITNEFERFNVRIKGADEAYLNSFVRKQPIRIAEVTNAVIYGDYSEHLLLTAKVIKLNVQANH